ncbi:MAG: hypothetical protein NC038_05600 [Paludibacter sp.]|nr:hypothetical protein [Bacteroidales bacterium]MCM1069847.1 hypothetical protein [Prevotella sp.]MCM1353960.1 hypothetical protein [Bacteroides sp.]MCM1443398.1 hypothetical protein [Muribaculum sp.]MCM1482101.1 hypothetical protein [Paludibacter sp.]
MKKTFIEQQKSRLIKQFHILLGQAGIQNDGKLAMLSSYGVSSSKDLTVYELAELCGKLDSMVHPAYKELDQWRKRLIGAIGKYLSAMGKDGNDLQQIMAIACRAAKTDTFNHISKDRLKSLYNAFNKRQKDIRAVEDLSKETVIGQISMSAFGVIAEA